MRRSHEEIGADRGVLQPPPGDGRPDAEERPAEQVGEPKGAASLVVDELLVEDVSIDGLCGVY
jgi:mycofactocin precursor